MGTASCGRSPNRARLWIDLIADLVVVAIRDTRFARRELFPPGAVGHAINPVPSFAIERGRLLHTVALLARGALSLGILAALSAAFVQANSPQGVPAENGLPLIPVPSGPFGIGRIGYDWIDPSRPDRYSSKPNQRRELMVYF